MYPESSTSRESQPRLLLVLGSAVTRYRYAEPCELGEAGESQALFDYMCLISHLEKKMMILVLKNIKTQHFMSCFFCFIFREKPWKGDFWCTVAPGWLRSFYSCSALLPRAVKVEGMDWVLTLWGPHQYGGMRWAEGSSLMRWLDDISHWTEIRHFNLHWETLLFCGVGSTGSKKAIFLLLWLALLISMLVG